MPIPPLPTELPCEETVDPDGDVTGAPGQQCGEEAVEEYLRRPQISGLPCWVAACPRHAAEREAQGLTLRHFTGISRW